MAHTNSIYLTGSEYYRVFKSKLLSRYSVKVDVITVPASWYPKQRIYYKVTADMPESAWDELVKIAETSSEVF